MGLGTLAVLGARRWEMLNSIHTNLAADCHLIVAVCIAIPRHIFNMAE